MSSATNSSKGQEAAAGAKEDAKNETDPSDILEGIKIMIKNDLQSHPVEMSPKESVAAIKASYLKSGKCTGHPNYILLLHKGKEIPDEKSLAELGITSGDVLVHIEAAHEPFRPVNYDVLAQALRNRRRHEENNLKMMQEDNFWAASPDGVLHRLGGEKSLISTAHKASHAPQFNHRKGGHGRAFFNQLSVRVNGCSFHVLPALEGRWNGEVTRVPITEEARQVCSCDLVFRQEEGVWSQRQTRTTISGLTTTYHYWIKAAADGIAKVETDDPCVRNCDVTIKELGTSILVMTAISKRSGRPILVETMTVVDSSRRVRTIQQFDESGSFRSACISNEQRVVDAVSGAMEKYEDFF